MPDLTPSALYDKLLHKLSNRILLNSSRVYLEKFVQQAADSVAPDSLVLDAGAGDCPYRQLFAHVRYETADFCQVENAPYGDIDYVTELDAIPVEDGRFDLILCTQVLEHVPDPERTLKELFRILKPGKALWISAPLFYEEHQIPFDFYRYTRFGLEYLLEKSGFIVEKIRWLEGYYGTLSYQFGTAALFLPVSPHRYGGGLTGLIAGLTVAFLKPFLLLLSLLFERCDLRYKHSQTGYCKNYLLVASKPS